MRVRSDAAAGLIARTKNPLRLGAVRAASSHKFRTEYDFRLRTGYEVAIQNGSGKSA